MGLPEVVEQKAWVGYRWRIRSSTFAHLFTLEPGDESLLMPPGRRALGATAVAFHATDEELYALEHAGPPFWRTSWGRNGMGLLLDVDTDWDEVIELITDSYCVQAPKRLADRVAADVGGGR